MRKASIIIVDLLSSQDTVFSLLTTIHFCSDLYTVYINMTITAVVTILKKIFIFTGCMISEISNTNFVCISVRHRLELKLGHGNHLFLSCPENLL